MDMTVFTLFFLAIGIVGIFLYIIKSLHFRVREMGGRADLFARGAEGLRKEKKALLENLNEGVVTLDAGGRISYVNSKAMELLDLPSEALLGKTYKTVAPLAVSRLWEGAKRVIEETLKSKERRYTQVTLGEQVKIRLEVIAVPTDEENGLILVIQDHSNQQKILDVGKDFIANASHELRTPITIIQGFAETLKDLEQIPEEMFESILEKIIRNCVRMESLIKNLLILADLDNHKQIQFAPCSLTQLVEEACLQILSIHPTVHIEQLQNEDDVMISGEANLIELALLNILKNAVKYSPDPAHIKITIDSSRQDVLVTIEDQGIGIPEKDLDKIFNRFYTVDKTHSRKLGGAGLGLSIVKIILDKHGAKIWATSEPSRGSTFHLQFLRP